MKVLASVIVAFVIFFGYASVWYCFTAIPVNVATSGVKAMSQQCGTEYRLEKLPLITGNWFCPEEK